MYPECLYLITNQGYIIIYVIASQTRPDDQSLTNFKISLHPFPILSVGSGISGNEWHTIRAGLDDFI